MFPQLEVLMNTALISIALSVTLLSGPSNTPAWQNNYAQARESGSAQKKPLVIVFGSSNFLATNANSDVAKLLSQQFVCVFVDTASPSGKQLAENFELDGGVGLVVTDRDCLSQAFWHQGVMENDLVLRTLRKYSERDVVVTTTEVSTPAPSLRADQPAFQPAPIYDRRGRLIVYSNTFNSSFYSQGGTVQPATRTISSGNC